MAHAPRLPALRAPVRLRGPWPAPSTTRLVLARFGGSVEGRVILIALGAVAIVALAVELAPRASLAARSGPSVELRADVASPGARVGPMVSAPSTPEAVASAAPMASTAPMASGAPAARPVRAPRLKPWKPPVPKSEVVNPWKE